MKLHLRDLFWLILVVSCLVSWWLSARQVTGLRTQLASTRERLKNAAETVESVEDDREQEMEYRRSAEADLRKYQLMHSENPVDAEVVTVDRKVFDAVWAEREFLYHEFNPQNLRVSFDYYEGKIIGYGINGILRGRAYVPLDE